MKNRKVTPSALRQLRIPLVAALAFSSFVIATSYYVASPPSVQSVSASVVISQVYGGGGNSGATFKNDFIELFNRGSSSVNLTGWSVQYAATTGTSWQVTNLVGSIAPGGYYLVQEAAGAGGTTSLPPPDATGGINMSATAGKVAVLNSTTALTGACPTIASIIDLVGYGTGTNCFEGSGPTATLSNTTSAQRAGGGCTDTDNSSADFSTGPPNPRNSASPAQTCGGSTNPSGVGSANPSTVVAGGTTLLSVVVTPGTNPASTALMVTSDLSSIGGSSTQSMFDDGTHGDAVAGDNVFSFQAAVSAGTTPGSKSLPVAIADAQSRSGSATISLTVAASSTNPSGTGAASPNTLSAGGSTLLMVSVTPGTNPISTGMTVTTDLSAIGGSGIQPFFDDGTHGDAVAGDNIFSFQATVAPGTAPGGKTLPATIADAQSRSAVAAITLTIQPQTVPAGTVVISQVYGGGGNSGSTYRNDFIELYNRGTSNVDVTGWSVQYNSAAATGTWSVTTLSGTIAPGHYYLVQESQGAGGTTGLPVPDATGVIAMSGTNAKVALVTTTLPLGGCPTSSSIIDLVGYGTANCFEGAPTPALTNTTAAIRKGNGCVDTDNNSADLFISGPIPRNSASPANSCGGDPNNPSGLGDSHPTSLDPASNVLLTVTVTPATTPPSTGITVRGDLTSIGGSASQQFFDDGSHGDATPGDNVFSLIMTVDAHATTGAKSILTTITDAQGRTASAPITLTVQSPTCGVERWSVKTGTDPDAALVDLDHPVPTTIAALRAIPAPVTPPDNARVTPTETTVYIVHATLTLYKKETDVDYHIVLQDEIGNTLITEVPCPCCVGITSPFLNAVTTARAQFDAELTALPFFQSVSIPVIVKGVGFFDFIHGQTGVAPNGIELHPILDIAFLANTTTTLDSSPNPSAFGQQVTFTATVTGGIGANRPTGLVMFKEGLNFLGMGSVDIFGHATFSTNLLSIGTHSITAQYVGDDHNAASTGGLTQTVLNTPPIARCKNVTVPADSSCVAGGSATSVDDGSFDPDGDAITVSQTPPGPYSLGDTTVILTVTDSRGASTSCTAVVTVVDNSPPSIAGEMANPSTLWPPNHKMVSVTVSYSVTDNCTPTASVVCDLTVSSNEPPSPAGDGHSSAQWKVVDAHHIQLSSERDGGGTGRIYTVTITCKDGSGNTATKTLTVTVPHNQ
jgi:Big-like domain-containing protein/lamin tail-like protein